MLSVAIAIDMPADSAVAAQVSRSCEAVVGEGRCPVAHELKPSAVVAWYAIVRSEDPTGVRLRVELRDRLPAGALVETRDLVFSERDRPASRWASVGAVIAALVAARDSPEATTRAPSPKEPDKEETRVPPLPWGVDLALLAGPGLDGGDFRFGALGRGFIGLPRTPAVLGVISFRYAERPGALDVAWAAGSLGMGARLGNSRSRVSAELIGEMVFERLFISGRNAATGHEASTGVNRLGGRLGLVLAVGVWADLGLVVGADASALRPSVDITFLDAGAGRVPPIELGLSMGLRFRR